MRTNRDKLEFYFLAAFLVLTRLADIIATYYVTPDLARETNPLVSVLGQGWLPLIGVQVVLVAAVIVLNYYALFKITVAHPTQRGFSLRDFATTYYLGQKQNWLTLLYKLPHRWTVFVRVFGFCLPRILIAVGILVSVSSTLLVVSDGYRDLYSTFRPALYVIIVVIALYYYRDFFKVEYAVYNSIRQ